MDIFVVYENYNYKKQIQQTAQLFYITKNQAWATLGQAFLDAQQRGDAIIVTNPALRKDGVPQTGYSRIYEFDEEGTPRLAYMYAQGRYQPIPHRTTTGKMVSAFLPDIVEALEKAREDSPPLPSNN